LTPWCTAIALQDSFAGEYDIKDGDWKEIANEWVGIEDKQEVLDATVDEEIEMIESESKPPAEEDINVEDDDEPDVEMKEASEEDILSFVEAQEMLRKLTISCNQWDLPPAATTHLDRLKKALFKAQASKAKKDTTLHAFFQPKKKAKKD
jgi:hypothetical protein